MGTVVFPDAPLKIFLTASPEQRAQRRMDELRAQNLEPSLDELIREIHERDARDSNRLVAPMRAAEDAVLLDSTELEPNAVVRAVLRLCVDRGLVPGLEES
jgi:cytidylate kinase